MFNNIDAAIEFVTSRRKVKHSIQFFEDIMKQLGSPQNSYKTIHISGTNGKGSVTWYLKDIFEHSGYKCGTFTSPHLIAHQDRIRINGEWIDDDFFLDNLNKYYDLIIENDLSMFEIDMMLASLYFKEKQVDIAIYECGIGGRLDITNILDNPLACVIVSVGFDHMDMLGDTLKDIAYEKAGIIKPNCKVFVGNMEDELVDVIKEKAINNELYRNVYKEEDNHIIVNDITIDVANKAEYQRHNMALALNVALNINVDIKKEGLNDVLKDSIWAGRFEKVCDDPLVIIDGAHNKQGVKALIETIIKEKEKYVVVFAGLKDKNVNELCGLLEGYVKKIIVTQFPFYRCQNVGDYDDKYEKYEDYHEALEVAMNGNDKVLVCGSLYFISEIRKIFRP